MTSADESKLFRFTIKHSILLMIMMGIISMMYAYVFPQYVPVMPPR
jgi:lactate permease